MRNEDWVQENWFDLQAAEPDVKNKLMSGEIEICPICKEKSAYAWNSTTSYEGLGSIIPGGFKPTTGTIAHISVSSGLGEWQCGHCKEHLVDTRSPLLASCYTHGDD